MGASSSGIPVASPVAGRTGWRVDRSVVLGADEGVLVLRAGDGVAVVASGWDGNTLVPPEAMTPGLLGRR